MSAGNGGRTSPEAASCHVEENDGLVSCHSAPGRGEPARRRRPGGRRSPRLVVKGDKQPFLEARSSTSRSAGTSSRSSPPSSRPASPSASSSLLLLELLLLVGALRQTSSSSFRPPSIRERLDRGQDGQSLCRGLLGEDDLAAGGHLVELADGDDVLDLRDEVVLRQAEQVDGALQAYRPAPVSAIISMNSGIGGMSSSSILCFM